MIAEAVGQDQRLIAEGQAWTKAHPEHHVPVYSDREESMKALRSKILETLETMRGPEADYPDYGIRLEKDSQDPQKIDCMLAY